MRKTSLRLDRDYGAWAGTRQDLLALGRVMEAQFNDERERVLQAYEDEKNLLDQEEAELLTEEEASESALERIKHQRQSAEETKDRRLNGLRAVLEVTDRENEDTRDAIDDMLDEYEFQQAHRVYLSCESWETSRRCSIRASNSWVGEVNLSVSGDTPWVRSAFGAIEKEVRKRRPWWTFLRHMISYFSITIAVAFGTALAVSALITVTSWGHTPQDRHAIAGRFTRTSIHARAISCIQLVTGTYFSRL